MLLRLLLGDEKFAGETPDYLLVQRVVLPALIDAGVTQQQIDTMTDREPAALLRQGATTWKGSTESRSS